MEWVQFLILFLTILGIFLTIRIDNQKYEKDLKEFREKWAQESKEYHERLVAIEEARNKIFGKK